MAVDTSNENDTSTRSINVTCIDFTVLLYSIIFHFVDVGYDFYTAYNYFKTGNYSYFAWTVAFILIPSIIMTAISIRMYVEDSETNDNRRNAFTRIALCVVGLIFQSAPLIRYCDSFWYAFKFIKAKRHSNKKDEERYYRKMADEDSDVSLLRVFECYLESAPQQVLQVTLLLLDFIRGSSEYKTNQLVILILSFISMGVCMANYHRLLKYDQSDKKKISKVGLLFQFLWHLNITVSRILTIAALATLHPFGTCLAVLCHWFLMSIWVAVYMKISFCGGNKIYKFLFSGATGLVYIFYFLNLKDGPTRMYYLIFYVLCFLENVSATVIWCIFSKSFTNNWIYYSFAVLPVLTFIVGILNFIIYYHFLHPKLKLQNKSSEKIFYEEQSNFQEQRISLNSEENTQI